MSHTSLRFAEDFGSGVEYRVLDYNLDLEHEDEGSSDDDYLEIFDHERFIRDGNDIRFQLPSNNAALALSKNMEDVQKKASSLKRLNTMRIAVVRRKSTKAPTIGNNIYLAYIYIIHCIARIVII